MMTAGVTDWHVWSTTARLVITEPALLERARAEVEDELAEIDAVASRFREDSELRRLVPGPNRVSPRLAGLLAAAVEAAERSDGDVDPTVGAAMHRLGYDRDIALITAGTVACPAVVPSAGWRHLCLRDDVLWLPRGVVLDLGATAKAVAADRAVARVRDRLDTGVLVSIGGDIATAGPAPVGGWQVRVQDLPTDPTEHVSVPEGVALATSSTQRRRWMRGGRRMHHIVDPRTGDCAPEIWRSVTVAAASCLEANTVSTASVVRGERALDWVEGLGLPARFVTAEGGVVTTTGWPQERAA
ncbi:MAG: FAD:protein FMN transferase [Nocardioidaceae bacterium]